MGEMIPKLYCRIWNFYGNARYEKLVQLRNNIFMQILSHNLLIVCDSFNKFIILIANKYCKLICEQYLVPQRQKNRCLG